MDVVVIAVLIQMIGYYVLRKYCILWGGPTVPNFSNHLAMGYKHLYILTIIMFSSSCVYSKTPLKGTPLGWPFLSFIMRGPSLRG